MMSLDRTSIADFEATLRDLVVEPQAPPVWRRAKLPMPGAASLKDWRSKLQARRSDLTLAALGVVLSLCCATFPWYVVMNPDKFGDWKGLKFAGNDSQKRGVSVNDAGRIGLPFGLPSLTDDGALDMFPTATTAPEAPRMTPGEEDQPFPGDEIHYTLVYATNGRAMISDGSGMYVVERGSALPDSSTVSAIEQRDGHWVIVTSTDKVVPLAAP